MQIHIYINVKLFIIYQTESVSLDKGIFSLRTKYLSTTALSKKLGMATKNLFELFKEETDKNLLSATQNSEHFGILGLE